ncbi:DUF4192 family protein [Streptomyces sp. FH025]|uniref:DUF4192 family protein n=1 Tax=Streptomyces sp. FH025 TaxID=2815937 RepID=UPI001A9F1B33|nr:DUF4192 family protein [Streptomyces sp. FH025]MBO1418714.1 DUF4192 family protein [Streptomyces sp. FH025]
MSDNTPFTPEMAHLADFVAGALDREPVGQIVVAEFGEPLRLLLADIPEGPHHWPSFARTFIGDVAELPATSKEQRNVALLVYARDGHGLEDADTYTAVWRHLATTCARYGLAVIESQFITRTHWWPLPADPTTGAPGPGTPRAAERPTADRHPVDDGAEGDAGVVADAVHAFARELEAGHEAAKQSLKPLLAAMLTGQRDIEELTDAEAARLLLAVQNGDFLHMASTYCEPEEVKRAALLWSRVAWLCVDPYRRLAAAPLTLLGAALLLDGDTPAAAEALLLALEVKPGDEQAQALLGLVSLAEIDRVIGAPVSAAESLRAFLRKRREL